VTELSGGSGADATGDDRGKADCAEVIADVWTLLDGECTAETRAKLRQHLDECPECLRRYGLEERIKALIATRCRGDKAPEGLHERLRLEISRTTIIRTQTSGPF
jgi:anti-sigma factor (TIGR02949 family)